MVFSKSQEHWRQKGSGQRLHAADPQFARGWISEELDFPYALPQLVEYRGPACQERVTIPCGFNSLGAPVEEPDSERGFEVADRLGDRGLSDPEFLCRLRHAPRMYHRKEDMQVAQAEAPTDASIPFYACGHRISVMGISQDWLFAL